MYWGTIAVLLCASIIYGLLKVRSKRAELAGVPQPPVAHWLLGNIPIIAKAVPLFPKDVHFQLVFNYIQQKYDMPAVWYLDLWPVADRFCFINDPVLVSQYTVSYPIPTPISSDRETRRPASLSPKHGPPLATLILSSGKTI